MPFVIFFVYLVVKSLYHKEHKVLHKEYFFQQTVSSKQSTIRTPLYLLLNTYYFEKVTTNGHRSVAYVKVTLFYLLLLPSL